MEDNIQNTTLPQQPVQSEVTGSKHVSHSYSLYVVIGLLFLLIVLGFYFIVGKKSKSKENQPIIVNNTKNIQPVIQTSLTSILTPHTQSQVYENQYMKVTIPTGWITKQDTKNPAAVTIIKGSYILFIDARTGQASGVQGGRFEEYAGNAPSAEALIINHPGGPCGTANTNTIIVNGISTTRTDYYVSSNDNDQNCYKPTNDKTLWYFSDVGQGINYYNIPNDSNSSDGWVITMAYNSSITNSFPVKASVDLGQALNQMSDIVKTLTIKPPIVYMPDASHAINTMKNTSWSSTFSEGANPPAVSCTDTANTSNFNQNTVQTTYNMNSQGTTTDIAGLYISATETQTRIETVEGILKNDGWSRCNNITKHNSSASELENTDIIDVFQKGSELANVNNNSFKNVRGEMVYNIFLTFYKQN